MPDGTSMDMKRAVFLLSSFTFVAILAATYYLACCVPVVATVIVPFAERDDLSSIFSKAGVQVVVPSAGSFGAANISITNPRQLLRNEDLVLAHAVNKDYYCAIYYEPVIEWFSWTVEVGDSSTIGLQ